MSRQPGTASLEKFISRKDALKKNSNFSVNSVTSVERTRLQQHVARNRQDVFEENYSEFFKRIDDYEGLFTTQQLNSVDFSDFKNHVFFDSAVSKVHYAYDRILNNFPYDESEYEFKQYFNKLSGFTKYVYENFIPKNIGYLKFDGFNEVLVNDTTGNILNDYNFDKKVGLVNLNKSKYSLDFWLYVDDVNNNQDLGTQILFQKLNNNTGITLYLDNFFQRNVEEQGQVILKNFCNINLFVTNNSSFYKCKSEISLGRFNHINFSSFIAKGKRICKFYFNGIRSKTLNTGSFSKNISFDEDFLKSNFTIGNGNNHTFNRDNSLNVIKSSGLKGYIDEFRFFTGNRSDKQLKNEKNNNIHSRQGLEIYFRFNEPDSSYLNNNIVLDYSGHKVHGFIRNSNGTSYTSEQISEFRKKRNHIDYPLVYELENHNPIIFSRYGDILEKQSQLLESAQKYDIVNPNIFYKFFPKNLFVNDSDFNGSAETYVTSETIVSSIDQNQDLLKVDVPENNTLVKLLIIWSRFFDQLKCYIDQISSIIKIDYEDLNKNKNHTSIILPYAISKLGFDFREIFPSPTLEKLENKNLTNEEIINSMSIRQIQNNLWKRFLINSQDYLKGKGTVKSIKSIFNSFGLEADTFINVREFNSQNKLNLYPGFKEKIVPIKCIDFLEKDILKSNPSFDINGLPTNRVYLESILFNQSPHIDLSSNWSIEQTFKFDKTKIINYNNKQSLFRIDIEQPGQIGKLLPGQQADPDEIAPYINVVFERAKNTSESGTISLYVNEVNQNSYVKVAHIDDVNILSGKIYYICVNKKNITNDYSEYTLNISTSDFGSKNNLIKSSKCFINIENKSLDLNNAYLRIGKINNYLQNLEQQLSNLSFENTFEGKLTSLKLWSKNLNKKEINIHKTDLFNTGIDSIDVTSIENDLNLNIILKENFVNFLDNVQNENLIIKNFVSNSQINTRLYVPEEYKGSKFISLFDYITLAQNASIDYPENYNRVNINSYQDKEFSLEYNNYLKNPNYETESNFSYFDDIRASIDFSSSKFINSEISKIILVNDYFTQVLSNRSNLYAPTYQSLNELKNVFYSKLEKEINIKQLYQIFKYFDNILEDLLFDAIPTKVHYQGFNFVYESSITERHKYQYKMSESRFAVSDFETDFSRYNEQYKDENYWRLARIHHETFDPASYNNSIIIKTPFK